MELQVHIRKGKRQCLVRNMVMFYMHHLKIQNSRFSLTVVSQINLQKDTGGWGRTTHTDTDIVMCIDARLNMQTLMTTLAHEMVHVKQIATGLLKLDMIRNKPVTIWKGKVHKEVDYLDQPWEILAFSKQEIMTQRLYNFMIKIAFDFTK